MKPQPNSRWSFLLALGGSVLLVVFVGCANKGAQLTEAQRQNLELRQQLRQSQQTIETQQDTIRRQAEQIDNLSELGPERLDVLFKVQRIKLGRYSGGTNLDEKPGDDGIRVYITPQDEAGRTVTAAGSIEVNVFDLAKTSEPLLMSYSFSPEQARQYWQAGGLANHYNITCPWKDTLPSSNEITIRVKFIDYLTGQSFTATKQCRIRPPE
ncbi:MAG: hypothetical protein GWP14_09420 [Actinobacteria bacterium]|nr:hypothetical protein [Actinomycetota bacterium]